jgi:hypothetical protein
MNPGGYDALIEMNDESSYSLTQNNGGEIDYDQLTSNKKNPKGLRKINVKINSSKELDHSFGNEQNDSHDFIGGTQGLGSAGVRYNNVGLTENPVKIMNSSP